MRPTPKTDQRRALHRTESPSTNATAAWKWAEALERNLQDAESDLAESRSKQTAYAIAIIQLRTTIEAYEEQALEEGMI